MQVLVIFHLVIEVGIIESTFDGRFSSRRTHGIQSLLICFGILCQILKTLVDVIKTATILYNLFTSIAHANKGLFEGFNLLERLVRTITNILQCVCKLVGILLSTAGYGVYKVIQSLVRLFDG